MSLDADRHDSHSALRVTMSSQRSSLSTSERSVLPPVVHDPNKMDEKVPQNASI